MCTIFSCLRSSPTQATTAEALPQGVGAPGVIVEGASSIMLTWNTPAQPNGIITEYQITRAANLPCQDQ